MTISAGQLRHRIAFDKRADVDDGYGNVQADWIEQFVISAGLRARLGGEAVLAERLSGEQPVTITIWQSNQTRRITTDWRARDVRTGTIFNIKSIIDADDSRQQFDLLCQSGVAE